MSNDIQSGSCRNQFSLLTFAGQPKGEFRVHTPDGVKMEDVEYTFTVHFSDGAKMTVTSPGFKKSKETEK